MRACLQIVLLFLYKVVNKTGVLNTKAGNYVFIKAYFLYKDYIESEKIDILNTFVKLGDTIIDVGANIGWFTNHASNWISEGGMVYAIEPETTNVARLKKILNENNIDNKVNILEAVASDHCGTVYLSINQDHPGDHKVSKDNTGTLVKSVTIDSIVESNEIKKIALIKIDVQGHEMSVLKGSINTIKNMSPVFYIEIEKQALDSTGQINIDIINFMAMHSYKPFLIKNKQIQNTNLKEIKDKLLKNNSYIDVLFTR